MNKIYNGHKNWNYWNVSLWINNDEGLYRRARSLASVHGKAEGARRLLAELPAQTPDGATYNISAVRAALAGI